MCDGMRTSEKERKEERGRVRKNRGREEGREGE